MTDFEKYIKTYLDMIPDADWIETLKNSGEKTIGIFSELSEEQSFFAYAEGKWTLKELLQHLTDTEKIFQYRALRFVRKDKTELSGFDENLFAGNSFANERSLESLIKEYRLTREISTIFFETLQPASLQETGIANGNEIAVETIGKLITGHNLHHLNIIEERYLPNL